MRYPGRLYESVLKPALAGLLALLLLLLAMLAVSHALHESFHADSSTANHLCVICHFAKGQVSPADAASVAAIPMFCVSGLAVIVKAAALPGFDYRLSPSRAPPRFSFPKAR